MEKDVDLLIRFFEKFTAGGEFKDEIGEQEASSGGGDAASGGGGGSTSTTSKWADVVGGPKRGVANPLDKKGDKWADMVGGPSRGVANQLT